MTISSTSLSLAASTAATRSLTPIRVDRHAEAVLGLDLVAFGDGDVAHVVAEAHHPQAAQRLRSDARPHPRADAAAHGGIADVAGHRLARHAEPGHDVGELAVAVGGLVEVHEVHVDRRPWQRLVGLGVQMEQRLAQLVEPVDPHLRRRERVHPRDHADAPIVGVGIEAGTADRRRAGEHRLPHERDLQG